MVTTGAGDKVDWAVDPPGEVVNTICEAEFALMLNEPEVADVSPDEDALNE